VKKLATVSTLIAILVACSSDVSYSDNYKTNQYLQKISKVNVTDSLITTIIKRKAEQTMLEQRAAYILDLRIKRAEKTRVELLHKNIIDNRIDELKQYVNKTWYVFSGSTSDGWDCSGLVIWFYEDLGITLPHSATKQGMLKPKIKNPLPGDIVVTKYKNSKNFIHSGIYIGDNKMIHSGFRAGQKTEIINLDDPSFDNQKHYFVRIVGD
jgi:cell wall-associated NlpC family hydrolase